MTNKTYRPLPLRLVALAATLLALAFAGSTAVPKATAAPPPEFYGLSVSSAGSDGQFDWLRIASTGTKTVRVEFNWKRDFYGGGSAASCPSSPLPASGFSWNVADNQVRRAGIRGITILPYLTGAFCSNGYPEPGSAEMTAWKSFAEDLADRYGPGGTFWAGNWDNTASTYPDMPIEKWEIGNEPNLSENNPGKVLDPQKYGKFLIETSGAIKASQPAAKTLTGGLLVNSDLYTYINAMYSPNPSSSCCSYTASQLHAAFDGFAIHPYDVTGDDDDVASMIVSARVIFNVVGSSHGAHKPISITEIGWPVGNNIISTCSSTATADHDGYQQKKNLYELYTWLTANHATYNVDMGVWHSGEDAGNTCGSGGSVASGNANQVYASGKAGLYDDAIWSKRPSFCEYVKFTAAPDCPLGVALISSPGMDLEEGTDTVISAFVNTSGGITMYDGTNGEDLTTSGATVGTTPGVALDPSTGAAKIYYRASDGKLGVLSRASASGSWSSTTFGSAGMIATATSPGVHRGGDSASGTLLTSIAYRDGSGNLMFLADTWSGWFGPGMLTGAVAANTSPAITRDPVAGTMSIAYTNTNGQIGNAVWTSSLGWTYATRGAANSVKSGTSPDVERDPSNGKTVIAYHDSSDKLAAHTIMPGAWVWGSANSGATMAFGADPVIAIDKLNSEFAVAYTNNSSDGVSVWRMASGGSWSSPSAISGVQVGPLTNPAFGLKVDSVQTEMILPFANGKNTALAQRLAFQTGFDWVWNTVTVNP